MFFIISTTTPIEYFVQISLSFVTLDITILREYERDLRSNEHYSSGSENKAWKKIRPEQDLNPWPLQYRCSTLPTELTNQLHVGLLAQLVEHCTGIAKVMGSNPVQAWIFFRPYFHYCSSSVHYCEDRFHIHVFICSSNVLLSYIHIRLLQFYYVFIVYSYLNIVSLVYMY